MSNPHRQYVFIVGPTASGKSAVALPLAQKLSAPIINTDSIQIYKDINIGSAKPSYAEMKLHPHYLFDFVDLNTTYTAADYVTSVQDLLWKENFDKALFVGGSGFYIQALQKGMFPNVKTPLEVKTELEAWIDREGFQSLWDWLKQVDPTAANKLSPNDHYRVRRAVEIMKTQDLTLTQLREEVATGKYSPLPPHQRLNLGLRADKDQLRERVRVRTQKMLDLGFVGEVEHLIQEGYEHSSALQSVGYKEVQMFLGGEIAKQDLFERIVTSTMQLIKKQMTWFSRDPSIEWFELGCEQELIERAMTWSKGTSS